MLKNIRSELKKVIWPTRKQLVKNSTMVIGLIVVFAIAILTFDLVIKNLDSLFWNIIN